MKKVIYSILTLQTFIFTAAFAQQAPEDVPPTRDQGMTQTFIMIAISLLFFYFILWRPEQKRRKALETQRETMKVGDRVTAMGIIGTVSRIGDTSVILKMVDGSKIEVVKGAITEILGDEKSDKVEKLTDDKE